MRRQRLRTTEMMSNMLLMASVRGVLAGASPRHGRTLTRRAGRLRWETERTPPGKTVLSWRRRCVA